MSSGNRWRRPTTSRSCPRQKVTTRTGVRRRRSGGRRSLPAGAVGDRDGAEERLRTAAAIRAGRPACRWRSRSALREGGKLEGCRPAPHAEDCVDFGEGFRDVSGGQRYDPLRVRAPRHICSRNSAAPNPKLPGQSVYITGYTPFDQTLRFEFS